MKVFQYTYDITWGNGCGFVVAKNLESAITKLNDCESEMYPLINLIVEEIDLTKSEIYDFSWSE